MRVLVPGGGIRDDVVEAHGAAVGAVPGAPPAFREFEALAQGARVEGMPFCGCEDGAW